MSENQQFANKELNLSYPEHIYSSYNYANNIYSKLSNKVLSILWSFPFVLFYSYFISCSGYWLSIILGSSVVPITTE